MSRLGFLRKKFGMEASNDELNHSSFSLEYINWYKVEFPAINYVWISASEKKSYAEIRKQRNQLKTAMDKWCKHETTDKWFVNANHTYFFKDQNDAIMFKLIFG